MHQNSELISFQKCFGKKLENLYETKLIVQLLSKIYERNNQNDRLFSLEDFLWINLPNAIFDYFFEYFKNALNSNLIISWFIKVLYKF